MKYKILVVDDDKELVKMLCSYFNMKQYETITATDGMEALNKIKMKPDIILLDINMPHMDGIEVCRLIRSKVLCPILFLTARVDEDDGIGFVDNEEKVTEPFYHKNPQDDLKHFGLGMYISRIFCEKHGGNLKIYNARQGGAHVEALFKAE